MREPAAITSARCALGARLATYRRAAGLTQTGLASLVAFSRSTIANVETGRQHVPRASGRAPILHSTPAVSLSRAATR